MVATIGGVLWLFGTLCGGSVGGRSWRVAGLLWPELIGLSVAGMVLLGLGLLRGFRVLVFVWAMFCWLGFFFFFPQVFWPSLFIWVGFLYGCLLEAWSLTNFGCFFFSVGFLKNVR